jgi:hypothetical protein
MIITRWFNERRSSGLLSNNQRTDKEHIIDGIEKIRRIQKPITGDRTEPLWVTLRSLVLYNESIDIIKYNTDLISDVNKLEISLHI